MSNRASLNHIYRSVWNPSLGVMVAVAEIASACCGATSSAQAQSHPSVLPTGGVAVHGSASFNNGQANKLVVNTQNGAGTNHTTINWNSFSIGAGNTTQFVQPSASSLSINRVVTNTPSTLFGTLSSNGKLVLVNQSGIAVGAGALVDTAGFTASAVGMSDVDAIAGRLRFSATGLSEAGGALTVQGNLIARGGDVVLIAPTIELAKTAVVEAQGGSVLLAAGQGVEVTGRGLEGITLKVQAPSDKAVNLGTLRGDAVGIFASTLKHSGVIEAATVAAEGGRVVLKAKEQLDIDGRVSVQGVSGKGGVIHATADSVVLRRSAVLDANGDAGGGEIRVGGGWHGEDARISNARQTVVLEGARITADATGQGDGGDVVIWADGATRFLGSLSARGAVNGGDGGRAEVSGKQHLDFRGAADLAAPFGRMGSLLLDPTNLTISAGPADLNGDSTLGDDVTASGIVFADFGTSSSVITAAQVGALLNGGNLTLEATNNIQVTSPIIKSAAGTTSLTLHASNNLTVNSPISTLSGDLNITLLAAGTIGLNAGLNAGAGDVSLTGIGGITQSAGAIIGKNLSALSSSGSVTLPGANVISTGVTLAAGNALIFNNASLGASTLHGASAGNAVNISTAGPLTLDGAVYSSGSSVSIQAAGALNLTDHLGAATTLNLDTSSVNGLIQQTIGDIAVGGLATINAGTNDINLFSSNNSFSSISLTGSNVGVYSSAGLNVTSLTYGANSNVYLDSGTGALSVPAMNILTTGQLSLFSGTSFATTGNLAGSVVILQAPDGLSLGHNINASALFLTADGISTSTGINQTAGTISVSGATLADAGLNNISLTSGTNDFNSFAATGLFTTVTDANSISLGNINTFTLDVISNGAITQVPGTSIASSVTLSAGSGNVSLDNSGNNIDFIRVLNGGSVSITNTGSGPINLDGINAASFSLIAGGDIGSCCSTIVTTSGGVSLKTTNGFIDLNTDSPTDVNSASGILIEATGNIGLRGVDLTANAGGNIIIKSSTGVLEASDLFSTIATITLNGGGRWLTYLNNPFAAHFYGPFVPGSASDFRQFDAPIGTAPLQGTGNGNLFAYIPSINADLTGAVSKVFDGTTPISLTGAGITNAAGYLFNDTGGTVSGTGDLSNPNVGTVIPVSAVSQPLAGVVDSVLGFPSYGYQVTATGNIGEVTAAVLSTISLNGSRVYDGTTTVNAGIFGLSGLVGSDDLTLSGAGTVANRNVGVNKPVTLGTLALGNGTIGLASNYTLSGGTHRATITPAPLPGLAVAVTNKVYDGTTAAALSNAVPSVFGSDSVTVSSASAVFSDKNVGISKPVTVSSVSLSGPDAANYDTTGQSFNGLADITAKSITGISGVTASSKVYDRTVGASFSGASASLVGVLGGDSVALSGGVANFSDKNVGIGKTVTVNSLGLAGADAANYTLVTPSATALANITPATITPIASVNNKVYDTTTVATYSISPSGLISGDTVSVVGGTAFFSDKNAALGKTVTIPGLTLNGSDAPNYTLGVTSTTAMADITKAAVTSVTGITASNKVYDGNVSATLSTTGALITGILGGDFAVLSGASGSFSDKNVGVGKTVSVTGLNLTGTDAGNYFLGSTTATALANITPATINGVSGVTANNKTYDATASAVLNLGTASLSGAISGDSVGISGTGQFADKNAGLAKVVNISGLNLVGTDAANYIYTGPTTTSVVADIARATISSITGVTAVDKVYDGTTLATISTSNVKLAGVLPGDTVTLAGAKAIFNDKNVGVAKPVNISEGSLGGADAANYVLANSAVSATANITQRPLSTWTATGGGSWSSAGNWDALPDGANVLAVSIPDGSGSISFDAGATSIQSLSSPRPIVISGGSLTVGSNLTVPSLTQTAGSLSGAGGLSVSDSFNQTGGTIVMASDVIANQRNGELKAGTISAPAISLTAQNGSISQTGALTTAVLQTSSTAGTNLNDIGNRIASFAAGNTAAGDITLVNRVPISLKSIVNTVGNLNINNVGGIAFSDTDVVVVNRNLTVVANSPLTVGAAGITARGDISLTATNLTSAGNITLNGPVKSDGQVSLTAANNMVQNSTVLGAKGVSASAGGSVVFGPQATSGNAPVSYLSSGVRVAVPGVASSDSVAATDNLVTLLLLYEKALELKRDEIFITSPDGTTRRKNAGETIVSEGEICRP